MKRVTFMALIVLFAVILTACATPTPAPTTAPAQPTKPPAVEPTKAPAPTTAPAVGVSTGESEATARAKGLTFLADAYAGKYKGTKVTMTGPFTDEDAVKFNNSMKDFTAKTGITIQYEG